MGPWNNTFKAIVDRWYKDHEDSILCKCDKSALFPRCDRNPDYCIKINHQDDCTKLIQEVAEATARDQK